MPLVSDRPYPLLAAARVSGTREAPRVPTSEALRVRDKAEKMEKDCAYRVANIIRKFFRLGACARSLGCVPNCVQVNSHER